MSWTIWIIPGAFILFVIYGVVMHYRWNKPAGAARRKIFRERGILDASVWYERYFEPWGCSRENSVGIANCLAKSFGCKSSQFRAEDAFGEEFKFTGIHWMGIDEDDEMEVFVEVELAEYLGKEKYKKFTDSGIDFVTVGELVRWCDEQDG